MHYIQPFFFFICQNLFKESMYCQLVFCSLNWDGRYTLLLLFASFSFYPVYIYHHCFTTLGNTLKSKTIFVQYIFSLSMLLTYLVSFCASSWVVIVRVFSFTAVTCCLRIQFVLYSFESIQIAKLVLPSNHLLHSSSSTSPKSSIYKKNFKF